MSTSRKMLCLLAAGASLVFAGPASAQVGATPGQPGDQPSGGYADQEMAAPTRGVQGSTTGQAHMNGPMGNGERPGTADAARTARQQQRLAPSQTGYGNTMTSHDGGREDNPSPQQ